MSRRTIFSECRQYRYTLWREWDLLNSNYAMFIGLNPSTADEWKDDPTIRRCIDFSKQWGYGALCMVNLFAFRATDPRVMMSTPRPIGEENDRWIAYCAKDAGVIVAAWGTKGQYIGRDEEVLQLVEGLTCLRLTKDGCPEHPLYLPKNLVPIEYQKAVLA